MSSVGEFGPILSTVIGDAAHGKVIWDHWETGTRKHLAVFRYSVPKEYSRFAIYDSLYTEPLYPAYHGEITVDPETGVVLRISEKTLKSSDDPSENGIVVEYGPVEIGGTAYTCPVHSVAFTSVAPEPDSGGAAPAPHPARILLNDVTFTNYHVFRSEVRILP